MKSNTYNLRPLRVAVCFDPVSAGGGYQQALNAAQLIRDIPADLVQPLYYTTVKESLEPLKKIGISAEFVGLSLTSRVGMEFRRKFSNTRTLSLISKFLPYNIFEKQLMRANIDIVYFLSPTSLATHLEHLNYIVTIWDTCHRDAPEFPEVRQYRQFEARETLYNAILTRAVGVLTDSELGKRNIVRRYGVDDDRVHVMPFEPAVAVQDVQSQMPINIGNKYGLDVPYVFYPAQFWSHKNHVYLLEGLRILEDEFGYRVGAIFSGTDKGNLEYIKAFVQTTGLNDRIRFAGFVRDEEIPDLYLQSLALVMPTYFGPTNLPPLEAFALGVPVLYPDKPGLREQVGDAALLMDLRDPRSMASHLNDLILNPKLREKLIYAGRGILHRNTHESRVQVLFAILSDFQRRRVCWK